VLIFVPIHRTYLPFDYSRHTVCRVNSVRGHQLSMKKIPYFQEMRCVSSPTFCAAGRALQYQNLYCLVGDLLFARSRLTDLALSLSFEQFGSPTTFAAQRRRHCPVTDRETFATVIVCSSISIDPLTHLLRHLERLLRGARHRPNSCPNRTTSVSCTIASRFLNTSASTFIAGSHLAILGSGARVASVSIDVIVVSRCLHFAAVDSLRAPLHPFRGYKPFE